MPDNLDRLAGLVRIKNNADAVIAELIRRPSAPGNVGEFVAARVFAIQLMPSGSHPAYDGVFTVGPLVGKTVNIKTYSRHESLLDFSPHPCDYFLVLTGPAGQARVLPWVIDSAFLFERKRLLATLTARNIKIGIATSVRKADWEVARASRRRRHRRCSSLNPSLPAGALLVADDPDEVSQCRGGPWS